MKPDVSPELTRRQFLSRTACQAAGVAAGVVGLAPAAEQGSDRVRIGLVGLRNRGKELATLCAANPRADIVALCDLDPSMFAPVQGVLDGAGRAPAAMEADYRRLLDRTDLDAVMIATPDHWHARMTTLACAAGKDVYVETPATWQLSEGIEILAAAQRSQRVVHCGIQERSCPAIRAAMDYLHGGELGAVRFARAWVVHKRKPLPLRHAGSAPQGIDYNAWLGAAPQRSFHPHHWHFNWRWFWNYGGGELAHWGSHWLDVARWGLGVEWPQRIAASGGTTQSGDTAETPDTMLVHYAYPEQTLVWEHRLFSGYGVEGRSAGVAFHAEKGVLVVDRGGWHVYDGPTAGMSGSAAAMQQAHLDQFLSAVLQRQSNPSGLWEAIVSAGLTHLGNAAYRVGHEITYDAVRGRCLNDPAATKLLAGR